MAVKDNFTLPFAISAAIHIGVIALLVIGIDFSTKPQIKPILKQPVVQAVVVDQKLVAAQVEKLKRQRQDQARREKAYQDDLNKKARDAKRERERELQKIKKLEIQRKEQEIVARKAEAAAKVAQKKEQQEKQKAKAAEANRKQKELEQQQAEKAADKAKQQQIQEELAAKKATQERERRELAEKKRKAQEKARQERELHIQQELAAEQAQLSRDRNKRVVSEVARYQAMITATIQRNLVVNESMRGKSCIVDIRLAKDGFVTSVRAKNGDGLVCRAAEAAINKAGRLPVSPEADVYNKMKVIKLTVKPEFN